jgi:hypothetical protein
MSEYKHAAARAAQIMSFASLAAEFAVQAETWPVFRRWLEDKFPGQDPAGFVNRDMAVLAETELRGITQKICRIAP